MLYFYVMKCFPFLFYLLLYIYFYLGGTSCSATFFFVQRESRRKDEEFPIHKWFNFWNLCTKIVGENINIYFVFVWVQKKIMKWNKTLSVWPEHHQILTLFVCWLKAGKMSKSRKFVSASRVEVMKKKTIHIVRSVMSSWDKSKCH